MRRSWSCQSAACALVFGAAQTETPPPGGVVSGVAPATAHVAPFICSPLFSIADYKRVRFLGSLPVCDPLTSGL